jgi:hypothetical protein
MRRRRSPACTSRRAARLRPPSTLPLGPRPLPAPPLADGRTQTRPQTTPLYNGPHERAPREGKRAEQAVSVRRGPGRELASEQRDRALSLVRVELTGRVLSPTCGSLERDDGAITRRRRGSMPRTKDDDGDPMVASLSRSAAVSADDVLPFGPARLIIHRSQPTGRPPPAWSGVGHPDASRCSPRPPPFRPLCRSVCLIPPTACGLPLAPSLAPPHRPLWSLRSRPELARSFASFWRTPRSSFSSTLDPPSRAKDDSSPVAHPTSLGSSLALVPWPP